MSNPLQETSQTQAYDQQPYQGMQSPMEQYAPPPNDPYQNQGGLQQYAQPNQVLYEQQQQTQPNYGYQQQAQPNYGQQAQPNYGQQAQPSYGQQANYGQPQQQPYMSQPGMPQAIVIQQQHQCVFIDQLKCGCRSFLCFCFCTPCWLGGICCNGNPCYCWDVDKVCSCGRVISC